MVFAGFSTFRCCLAYKNLSSFPTDLAFPIHQTSRTVTIQGKKEKKIFSVEF